MGEIVNLRKVRKQAKRADDARRAELNRIAHGRSKAERNLEAARSGKTEKDLEAHRIETGDGR